MVKISPFQPVYFNGNYCEVTSPPFDSINKEMEKNLKRCSENVTHLTLPDNENYTYARVKILEWVDSGVLKRAEKPVLVLIDQSFNHSGKILRRTGIISLVDVFPDDGYVKPHEKTFIGPVKERMKVLGEMRTQPEPIFLAVNDRELEPLLQGMVAEREAMFSFTDGNGVSNSVYFLDEEEQLDRIVKLLKNDSAMVADGHHRLEASRRLAGERSGTEKNFWSSVMAYITSMNSPGLFVSGIHRIVKTNIEIDSFLNRLAEYFLVNDNPPVSGKDFITVYLDRYYYLLPPENNSTEGYKINFQSPIHALNTVIFNEIMGIDSEGMDTEMEFTHDEKYAVDEVRKGRATAAFIMPDWDRENLFRIVLSDGVLPQKSTYFHPKVHSGIVLNVLF